MTWEAARGAVERRTSWGVLRVAAQDAKCAEQQTARQRCDHRPQHQDKQPEKLQAKLPAGAAEGEPRGALRSLCARERGQLAQKVRLRKDARGQHAGGAAAEVHGHAARDVVDAPAAERVNGGLACGGGRGGAGGLCPQGRDAAGGRGGHHAGQDTCHHV